MTLSSPDPRVDDVRQRLRSLGYLDAGVDRFVLGSANATRRPWSIALLASIRLGVVAAILLGPAAAIGLTGRLPGLVTGPRDALVIALYLSVFFGAAVTVAAFASSLIVSWLARRLGLAVTRRGNLLSRLAGVLVTLACLTYLTLWWQTVIAGVGWSSPLWTATALAVAAAISVLLGHAVTVISLAVIVAAAPATSAPAPPAGERRSSWWTSLATGAAAFAAAALLLTWSAGSTRGATDALPTLTVIPSGLRVRLIAIDGFDARIFEELAAAGRVNSLAAAFQGALGHLQPRPGEAGDPARVWTTVATGQPPSVHRVTQLETRRVAGVQGSVNAEESSPVARAIRGATDLVRLTRPAIASGSERRARTFWEVASSAGLRTVVVNWWATWPAPDGAGVVLSDRATLRLEHGGPLDAEISPATLYEPLRGRWPAIKARAAASASEALRLPAESSIAALLQRSAELDAIQIALLTDVASKDTDLAIVYLPGLDITQHALLGASASGSDQSVAASTLSARLDALKEYYIALDRMLAPILTPGADEMVMIVTEPGRVASDQGARFGARGSGLISTSGANAVSGSQTDVAPTVLHALGVPVSRDLDGAPLLGLFTPEFVRRYPVRFVPTYGLPTAESAARTGTPLDQEMIDRLRSLGYVR